MMSDRFLALAIAAVVLLAPSAGQTTAAGAKAKKKAAAKTWTPPLTPDGQPDLQGVWLSNSATPLERPKALEGKASLTDAEFDHFHRRLVHDALCEKTLELEQAHQRLAVLVELGQQLAQETDPECLLDNFCHAARHVLAARFAFLGLRGHDGQIAQRKGRCGIIEQLKCGNKGGSFEIGAKAIPLETVADFPLPAINKFVLNSPQSCRRPPHRLAPRRP